MSSRSSQGYHLFPTGLAAQTASSHSRPSHNGLSLFAAGFCPFVQRVWIAFELLGVPYQYIEVDPYRKQKELLDVSSRGLVPGLRVEGPLFCPKGKTAVGVAESTVILEFLEDIAPGKLLPPKELPYERSVARFLGDRVSRTLVPAFYRYLQAQVENKQAEEGLAFRKEVEALVEAFPEGRGPWAVGDDLGWVEVVAAPWIFRSTNVLKHYRSYNEPDSPRYIAWRDAIFSHPAFKATVSTEELYLDSYARYAENRPNTSQVADAINSGKGLP